MSLATTEDGEGKNRKRQKPLWEGANSSYKDVCETKKLHKVYELKYNSITDMGGIYQNIFIEIKSLFHTELHTIQ